MCCLAALGIGMGDEVIVPGYTFIASIATIAMMNAIPVLAEIDESLTIDPAKIEALITPKTKAIMPVHMLGNPCDMDPIMEIAKKHNLYVIEDCCQAVGAAYHGKRVGTIGDMGAYSLNVFKTITTGDGGFVGTAQQVAHGGLCRPVVRKLRLMLGQILFRIPGRLVAVKYRARLCVLHHRTHELGRVGERRLGVPQLPGQFVSPIHRRLGAG